MDARDRSRLAELTEAAALENMVEIAGEDLRATLGLDCRRVGGGVVARMGAAPDVPSFTRALGLGFTEPLTGDVLDESLDYLRDAGGAALLVQLSPFVETPEVLQLLASRGLERGRTWAKMMRPIGPPPQARCELRIEKVGPEHSDEFAHVLLTGMEMPMVMAPFAKAQMDAPGWSTFAAFDGGTMVATGSMFVHEDVAQLAGAATLETHRGRGAQLALMAARIEEAASQGASWVTAETGSEEPDDPNPSLHNMRRAGMEELYARQNWLLRL